MSMTLIEPALGEKQRDIPHGLSGYTNNSCRCSICRGAMNSYQLDRRQFLRQGHAHLTPGWRDQLHSETTQERITK